MPVDINNPNTRVGAMAPDASTSPVEQGAADFYIVDVREEWRRKPYITVWRPDDAGYAFPLAWAGRYTAERINEHPSYYHKHRYGSTRVLERYPVPCAVVELHAVAPSPGIIDGDAGPVLPNTGKVRAALRRARYVPQPIPEVSHVG